MPRPFYGIFAYLLAGCLLAAAAAKLEPRLYNRSKQLEATVHTIATSPGKGRFQVITLGDSGAPDFVYEADLYQHVIRGLDLQSGSWKLVAGTEGAAGFHNGRGSEARFSRPLSLCIARHTQRLVVWDDANACLRSVDVGTGDVQTLAGDCRGVHGFADGPASQARFGAGIRSLACLDNCSVVVGDATSGRLRLLVLDDPSCQAGGTPGGQVLTPGMKAALAVTAGLSILAAAAAVALAVRRWAADRAEEAAARMADHKARAVRAAEDDITQVAQRKPGEGTSAGWKALFLQPDLAAPTAPAEAAPEGEPLSAEAREASQRSSAPAGGVPERCGGAGPPVGTWMPSHRLFGDLNPVSTVGKHTF